MVTLRTVEVTDWERRPMNARRRRCVYCRRLIVWMVTYLEGRFCAFNSEPTAAKHDTYGHGWVPELRTVLGVERLVLVPLRTLPAYKRKRVADVMILHSCAGKESAAA